jgi:DNA recombination protein RmuC
MRAIPTTRQRLTVCVDSSRIAVRESVAVMNTPLLPFAVGLLGLGVGIVVTTLVARVRQTRALALVDASHRAAEVRATDLAARLEERSTRIAALEANLACATAEGAAARAGEARLEAALTSERTAAAEKLAVVHAAEAALREAFQALSAKALQDNNAAFLALAKTALGEFQERASGDLEHRRVAIDALVKPIRESLERVGSQLQTVEKERVGAYSALSEQVQSLAVSQQQLQGETAHLVRALRTPSVRGHWGEMQLRRVVELAGMLPHCDFYEQQTVTTDEGRRRPDLIVQLPGGRHLVVDAKAPLLAYLDALEATDESLRDANLKEHARQVRDHVSALGAKTYWAQFQPSPELVVMFLPAETFLNAALQHDPTLIEFAAVRRVVLASPTSLIALLYAVAHGWQQQAVAEGVLELSRLGRDLYDRLRTMVTHFEQLRRGLNTATTAYNDAMGSLEKRVLVAARRFKDLNTSAPELPLIAPLEPAARGFASIADADEDALPVDDPDF